MTPSLDRSNFTSMNVTSSLDFMGRNMLRSLYSTNRNIKRSIYKLLYNPPPPGVLCLPRSRAADGRLVAPSGTSASRCSGDASRTQLGPPWLDLVLPLAAEFGLGIDRAVGVARSICHNNKIHDSKQDSRLRMRFAIDVTCIKVFD